MKIQDIMPATFIILIAVSSIFILTRIFLGNQKAGFLASGILIWFFVYGHIYVFLRGFHIGNMILGRNILLIPVWTLMLALAIIYLCVSKPKSRTSYTYAANLISVLLLFLCFINIGMYQVSYSFKQKTTSTPPGEIRANTATGEQNLVNLETTKGDSSIRRPNIFYIILDSYSSDKELKNFFNYDNQAFTISLKDKGFYVADQSHSNYAFTGLSLSSSLNMEYLNYLSKQEGEQSKDKSALTALIQDNKLMKTLAKSGYNIQRMGSWYSLTSYSDKNTSLLKKMFFTEFIMVLLKTTLLHAYSEQFIAPMLRDGVLETFEGIKRYTNTKEPTFTFAHIICPHPPFIFGEHGESISFLESITKKLNPSESYIAQLKYINTKTLETVQFLIDSSSVKPIIIIQGDHGAAYVTKDYMASQSEPPADFIKAQMGILNAYYVPENVKQQLYPSITPVNSFRKILTSFFGAKLDSLPDSSYYSRHISPYKFENVTTIVK